MLYRIGHQHCGGLSLQNAGVQDVALVLVAVGVLRLRQNFQHYLLPFLRHLNLLAFAQTDHYFCIC